MTTLTLPKTTAGIFEDMGYTPTKGQLPIVLYQGRFILVTGGQQAGKSELGAKKFQDQLDQDMEKWQPCVFDKKDPSKCPGHDEIKYPHLINNRCDSTLIYWLVGAEYLNCEEEFLRIYQDLITLGLPATKSSKVDTPGWIYVKFPDEPVPRISITVKSEARPDAAFARVSPHGILACEAGQLSYNTFNLMNSRTIGRKSWLWLIGTIEKAQPWFSSMAIAWTIEEDGRKSFQLPTWSNNFLFPLGIDDPEIQRIRRENSDDFFMERIAGKSVPPEGLVFTEFNIEVHVSEDVVYIPGEPVYIFVDPGYAGIHALEICHKIDGQYRVFDEFHESSTLTKDAIYWCTHQDWWQDAKELAIDPYYRSVHHAQGSIEEIWRDETGMIAVDNKRLIVELSDMRLAQYLHVNPQTKKSGLIFNPKCVGVISEFGAIPSPHSGHGEVLAYRKKVGDQGESIGKNPIAANCDGIRALEAGITYYEGMNSGIIRPGITRRGGQKFSSRRKGQLPHERLKK